MEGGRMSGILNSVALRSPMLLLFFFGLACFFVAGFSGRQSPAILWLFVALGILAWAGAVFFRNR